jgi:hypothetical protein
MGIFRGTSGLRDPPVTDWGPPVPERSGSAVEVPKTSFPWGVVSFVTAFVILAALLVAMAVVWQ